MNGMKDSLERWTVEKSADLYSIHNWGAGYFNISEKGDVVVTPMKNSGKEVTISLMDIVSGIKDRGLDMPVLIRIENILDSQISLIHENFGNAIRNLGYKGVFKGVYPIKVNQQREVVEEVTKFGARYHHGLEAGSKAELIAALAMLKDPEACLICNGYKDEEFVDLGLYACKMGYKCFFVIEMPSELTLILERSEILNIRPLLGIRIKLSSTAGGHWTESCGDRSIFGLNINQLVDVIDKLKEKNMLDCLQLLHYHIGSQVPNIRDIRSAALEASQVYSGLVREGAKMGYLDLGGGLAVDYDGSHTNYMHSRNYTLDEYCSDVIETIMTTLDTNDIGHPTIITESGRATVAYYSVLLFNILDVSQFQALPLPENLPEDTPELILNISDVLKSINIRNIQECYNDALYYRDEIRQRFKHGDITLRDRSLGEMIFWHIIQRIASESKKLKYVPQELKGIDTVLADIYYGNFSVFQSLPDAWAIDHHFPIMPIHRLTEEPTRQGIVADITCDCDGKIDKFIDIHGVKDALPLHELRNDEEYYLGVFLVGAYQETLGDLHNLLGDTNVVSIRVEEDGDYSFVREIEGDSVADVLTYVEYDPKQMIVEFRKTAEEAIRKGLITPHERRKIMDAYETGLRGYTYFER
ncbi:MAG: arginine decarboxylase [Desulfobacteraceae bacterium IS3]|nr:MAG: arginine decarboxylase [Desulfobacteraceae bacterium IS3]